MGITKPFLHIKKSVSSGVEYKMLENYILNKEVPDDLKQVVETDYFTMCLLMPKQSFIKTVLELGGAITVLDSVPLIKHIASIYGVTNEMVPLRIMSLRTDFSKNAIEHEVDNLENSIRQLHARGMSLEDISKCVEYTISEIETGEKRKELVNKGAIK